MTKRIINHPILDTIDTSETVSFIFDNTRYEGLKGEPIASALLVNGVRKLRVHEENGSPRGIYCNIGHCFECRVQVDGKQGIRACLTPIEEGMTIFSGEQLLASVRDWRPSND